MSPVTTVATAEVPACRAYHDANQSTTSATQTALALNQEVFDTDAIHDDSTNNSRLTCKTAGVYQISGSINVDENATGTRQISIRLNGSTYIDQVMVQAVSGADTRLSISTLFKLAVNEYVELMARQDSGGSLNVLTTSTTSPAFGMVWVGTA